MAKIAGEIIIGRPVEAVFDFAADQRNEPRYNPRMIRAEKISDHLDWPPPGAGDMDEHEAVPGSSATTAMTPCPAGCHGESNAR